MHSFLLLFPVFGLKEEVSISGHNICACIMKYLNVHLIMKNHSMFYANERVIGAKILYKLKPLSRKKGQLTTLALKALDPTTNRNNVRPVAAVTAAASDQQRTSGQCGCLCGALRARRRRRRLTNVPWERQAHTRHPCTTHSYARNRTLNFIFNHLGVFWQTFSFSTSPVALASSLASSRMCVLAKLRCAKAS